MFLIAVRYESDALPPKKTFVKGDYLEFGVYEGQMFRFAYKEAGQRMPWDVIYCATVSRFTKPKGMIQEGVSEGQFACSTEQFLSG